MKRTALAALLAGIAAFPALASETQLARKAGVDPGLYSTAQLTQLIALRSEGGNDAAIDRILADPMGAPLVSRLSTTTYEPADR